MTGKVMFITGAGSGMGKLAAQRALVAGERVVALDVNAAGLADLGRSPGLLTIVADLTDPAAVTAAITQAEEAFGPIDRVYHAAAIMPCGRLLDQDAALIHKVMAINYGGLVNLAKAVVPGMVARGRGQFVSFSSLAGHATHIYMGAYNASKFAVSAFTEVLHHENRRSGVQFACVCPPAVGTPLLNQARDTVWPRMFDTFPPLSPDAVLDSIERGLARGEFWIFPGLVARTYYLMRRLVPRLVWWNIHRMEKV
ncbi:short-chain dehydrogenase/reductase SDR [Sphingobium chlorophenolicum L-1]|uniref:Short-chain dehydrogenase/reductase SDR n=1 Tax=Sphingobium chlorophenolicum L-1 TaxID=690566 RepID=F6EUH2_SPHCR|nr:SDR family NAD(P)-dependent oxidoreductase [Sphingobium chlorophenolicum]AEG47866.1 short-chain dehydrogenase/reductase SDR [Sphingobium chlorophenolicum L-1]